MNFLYYNSRDELFKSPYGAIAEGGYIRFRLRLPKDCGVWYAFLLLNRDGEEQQRVEMTFEWHDADSLYYKCDIAPSSGLYWYSFCYETENDCRKISKSGNSCILGDGDAWQLTVYNADFKTPDNFRGGIIYQIFPDRFYRSENAKINAPQDRFLRDDWGAQPAYLQNGEKCNLGTDFFGGNLAGITEKIAYLKSLNVTVLYLNPIFLASSNHRYNTADYEVIDTVLGCEQDFVKLCETAHKNGIKVILDGVFSHTGDDSKYFDRYGKNTAVSGAAQSKDSPYYSWYKFTEWPHKYHSWWGIETLPEVIEEDESFKEYICGENGILRKWLRLGADGWRLDVADELPDEFLDALRTAVKSENPNALILGEVWEDASNKISYGYRRRYFGGQQLDSVMNYPFATAIVSFVKNGNSEELLNTVQAISENYPPQVLAVMMNHIGTHDTARILTVLGFDGVAGNREWQAHQALNNDEYNKAVKRLYAAAVLQYTLVGIPSVFYGDEVGVEGWADPFCRACYPWGAENTDILHFYTQLGKLRADCLALKETAFKTIFCADGAIAYIRYCENDELLVAVNCAPNEIVIQTPRKFDNPTALLGTPPSNGAVRLSQYGFSVIKIDKNNNDEA